jgi:hypothetical protein
MKEHCSTPQRPDDDFMVNGGLQYIKPPIRVIVRTAKPGIVTPPKDQVVSGSETCRTACTNTSAKAELQSVGIYVRLALITAKKDEVGKGIH